MGLDTHRVSKKVSKITSRHLVPLDRAFPAHALVHESKLTSRPNPGVNSPTNTVRLRATKLGHLVEGVARDHRLGHAPPWRASAKTTADDRFVPKEGILHLGLPMIASGGFNLSMQQSRPVYQQA